MTPKNDAKDLCITCLNLTHCCYHKNQSEPMLFCEEFTCYPPKASNRKDDCDDAATMFVVKNKQTLCVNCSRMDECNWDKSPEKIHCEEYE